MKKIFTALFSVFLLAFGMYSFTIIQEKQRIKINEDFSLVIPLPNVEVEELFSAITKANPNVVFLRLFLTSKNEEVLFAVSRYETTKALSLRSAFYEQTANHKANNLGEDVSKKYKLISFREYKKSNRTLYTKVSRPFEGHCNVMYYFMKNNFSNVMYEIKLSGKFSEKEEMESLAEKIALSVKL
jgi:hypothetical protein